LTKDTQLNVFADFSPVLPESYRKAEVLFLANIDPDLQQKVTAQIESPAFVAADTMNFWIQGKKDALLETLKKVNILLINDGEAKMLAEESNLIKAAKSIMKLGPEILVIKRGEYGAMLFYSEGIFVAPAMPLESVFDPTGCGDTFAGGFVGYLAKAGNLDPASLRKAMIVGSTLASFNVEAFSLDRMRSLTMDEIRNRYDAFAGLVRFEPLD